MFRANSACIFFIFAISTIANTRANGQTTLFVDDDACPSAGAGSQADPLCRIQRAIDLSHPGDDIVVAQGTYNELINFIGKGVTVRSSDGAAGTVIDVGPVEDPGTGKPVVRFDSGEGPNSILDGFTLTGGTGQAVKSGDLLGGGMFIFNSSPTVMNCVFSGNAATDGAGMFSSGGSPTVIGCSFEGNTAARDGGGMEARNASRVSFTDCTFTGNSAIDGGGMRSDGSRIALTRCLFSGNTASGKGGGIYNALSDTTVTGSTFDNNSSVSDGGGMYNTSSNPIVTNTMFIGNITTGGSGGGAGMFNTGSSPTVTNCTFSGNTAMGGGFFSGSNGGGILNTGGSNPTLISSTFTGNVANGSGGGIANFSGVTILINCIVSNNSTSFGSSPQVYNQSTMIIRFSNIEGSGGSSNWQGNTIGTDGGGNIDASPLFVDANGADNIVGTLDDDLRLSPGSPSIDAGFSFATLIDLDGNTRIVDDPATADTGVGFPLVIDMGAYEFGSSSALTGWPDLDRDGDVDVVDFALMQVAFTGPVAP